MTVRLSSMVCTSLLAFSITACKKQADPEPIAQNQGLQQAKAQVVQKNSDSLKGCYAKRSEEVPSLAGMVKLQLNVANGQATDIQMVENTTGDMGLNRCVMGEVRSWSFPAVLNGPQELSFTFPLR